VQEALGGVEALLAVSARLLGAAAAAVDAGQPPSGSESGLLKLALAENAVRAVEQCAGLAGNHGLTRHNPLERHWRDVLCARIHSPQADAARLAAGRLALLG
jgi:alkylation response protein AidB-like acyl-CoA dehydrogenase